MVDEGKERIEHSGPQARTPGTAVWFQPVVDPRKEFGEDRTQCQQ